MERFFNTAGPIQNDIHYGLPSSERWNLEEISSLIDQRKYFLLHAPRQTGKTTALLELTRHLNQEGRYLAAYADVSVGQALRENVAEAMHGMFGALSSGVRTHSGDDFLRRHSLEFRRSIPAGSLFLEGLEEWCRAAPKPVVLLLDEVDALVGDTLVSLLRQLRSGYPNRPAGFPQSVVLCGVRDLIDYRISASSEKAVITGGSAFNIKAESLRLGDFTKEQLTSLYLQHTEETGQVFEESALDLAWELSLGQPWLANALAYEVTWNMKENRDRSRVLNAEMFRQAAERLIQRRETHLDQLTDKLQEPRVRHVIHPIVSNDDDLERPPEDDIQYCVDLGLVRRKPTLRIANPIYREVIPRALIASTEAFMTHDTLWFVREVDGKLDMAKLIAAFQQFFREQSDAWMDGFDYHEAGPQLLLQAYLQRIVNTQGRITREYGLGRKRTDLFIEWPLADGDWFGPIQRIVLELKLRRPGTKRETLIAEALPQSAEHAERANAEECHLLIFDRDPEVRWEDRIFHEERAYEKRPIGVWGM